MKKTTSRVVDELQPEYNFAAMKGGVRGKYIRRLGRAANLALLEPELAKAFPSDVAVNEALRGVLAGAKASGRSRRAVEQRVATDEGR